jgi:hypothetical protein
MLLRSLAVAALAGAGCAPAPPLGARRARRGLAAVRAHRFAATDASRYVSLLRVPEDWAAFAGEHWLVLKNGSWPSATRAASLVAFRGCDARLRTRVGTDCMQRGTIVARGAWQLHNYALLFDGSSLWGVTGETSAKHASTLRLSAARYGDQQWLRGAGGLSMDHPGCVERRAGYANKCLYDGRFSLATLGNRTWLYARGNTNPRGGGRAVFVARREDDTWGRLDPIEFLPGAREPFDLLQSQKTDVYYGAVAANPAHPSTLLGLFPAASRDRAAIVAAVSCDGLHFSAPVEIWRSAHDRGEIVDHVVDGVAVDGADALLYVHAGVPGTLRRTCEAQAAAWRPPPSELIQLRWPLAKLRGFAREGQAALRLRNLCVLEVEVDVVPVPIILTHSTSYTENRAICFA